MVCKHFTHLSPAFAISDFSEIQVDAMLDMYYKRLNIIIAPGAHGSHMHTQIDSPSDYIKLGERIVDHRIRYEMTQTQAAKKLKMNRRQLQGLEQAGRWWPSAKKLVTELDSQLTVYAVKQLSYQSWDRSRTLCNAIRRLSEGKRQSPKRKINSKSSHCPDLTRQVDELTYALGTRVDIRMDPSKQGHGQILIDFFSWEQFDTIKKGVQRI